VDEAMVSGEPVPVEKQIASQVIGGTLNTDGSFTMEATKVGSETVLAHIIDMVAKAQGSKAPVQRLADQISAIFVPAILVVAVIALGLWLLLGTPAIGLESALTYGLSSFVGILVIACPCALGLATPTAIIVGIGKGAGAGILIKDATTLEKLSKINTLVVDKTGTITRGAPELIDLTIYEGNDETEALELLASLENRSEHPIGRAIVNAARQRGIAIGDVKDFSIIKGQGLVASRGREIYYAGNAKLMAKLGHKIDSDKVEQRTLGGDTPVFLATRKSLLALAFVADAVKPEAALAVAELKALGLHLVMLSGDNPNTARHVADLVGIGDVIAEGSPEVKLMEIKKLQALGRRVAMAGDGVNDAPALAQADVGIAMGTGTDVAIGAAGLTLLHGDISRLVKAVKLSRSTMTAIHQNLFWAFSFNLTGIPLAAGLLYPKWGLLLSPAFAGAAMAFSSVAVVSNSLRLKLSGVR
jgi:Cu2+-exporting ATPase/Cu+-exporting ATPase